MHQMPDLSRATWRKSSYSNGSGGSCVEVAGEADGQIVAVRDSKDREGPVLVFSRAQWRAFAAEVKAGRFVLT